MGSQGAIGALGASLRLPPGAAFGAAPTWPKAPDRHTIAVNHWNVAAAYNA